MGFLPLLEELEIVSDCDGYVALGDVKYGLVYARISYQLNRFQYKFVIWHDTLNYK